MPLQCNIDSKGKLVRLIYGTVLIVIGIVLVFTWAIGADGVVPWLVIAALVLAGGFAIFEAIAGWCVVRAMGFKTPM